MSFYDKKAIHSTDKSIKTYKGGNTALFILLITLFLISTCAEIPLTAKRDSNLLMSEALANEPLPFLSVDGNQIVNQNDDPIKLRGFHYDCFYFLTKKTYDAITQSQAEQEQCFVELSKYYCTEDDLRKVKEMGANVIRVGFRLWHIEKSPYAYSETSLAHLDNVISNLGKYKIYAILDLHAAGQNHLRHNEEYGNVLWADQEMQKRVIALWGVIASRYNGKGVVAGYDIINEPMAPSKAALHSFYERCIKEIRKYDKRHIIFLEANIGKNRDLLFGGEYSDKNIALSIHFYKPHQFTAQGRKGKGSGFKYPAAYGGVYWDKNEINKFFTRLLSRQVMTRPLYVGEFGATVWSGGQDSKEYLHDLLGVMNSKNIHYTYFSYKLPMRGSLSYYAPRIEVVNKLRSLLKDLNRNRKTCDDLKEPDKMLFHTRNFESPPGLEQVLKRAFQH
jgi:hypothetical protein